MEERVGRARGRGPGARGRAAPPADDVRPRDDARARLLHRHRELLAPPVAARGRARRPWTLLDYFPPDWLLVVDESHMTDPAGRRHVQERPDAQGDPRRLRVPAAVGARQPAADVRGVRGDRPPGDLHERDARPVRARAQRAGRPAAHPADRRRRPGDHASARPRARSTTCSRRSAAASSAASGRSSRRSPRRWPRT